MTGTGSQGSGAPSGDRRHPSDDSPDRPEDSPGRSDRPANRSSETPTTELAHLTSREVERRLAEDPRLLLAVGSLEQHGPHLPLGTNILIADRVVQAASRSTGVLQAPTLQYGVGAPTKRPFPGAASLQRKTLHRTLNEILAAWEDAGVRELVIVTANHYEPHLDALLMALTSKSITTVVDLRSIPTGGILEGDPISEHGGELETSLLLHLAPEMVRQDEIADFIPDSRTFRKYVRGRRPTPPPDSPGVVGRPSLASHEKGERLFRRYVSVLRDRILEGS
ncbi:MAG: creatininase family protein [Longimicrobiales bacterium]|nr:creatininase family protein [Longimicrobiales bacterium]